jgi:hypothetical protein
VVPLHNEHFPVPPHSLHSWTLGCSPVPRQTLQSPLDLIPSGSLHIGHVSLTQLLGAVVVPKQSGHFPPPPQALHLSMRSDLCKREALLPEDPEAGFCHLRIVQSSSTLLNLGECSILTE